MKTWKEAVQDGVVSGSISSLLSTAVLGVCGKLETDSPFAPTNATSHWIWGEHATWYEGAHKKYTLPGYLIHHGATTLWATVYEKWFGEYAQKKEITTAMAGAAGVSVLACFVDYQLTPKRLRPGFEKHLSRKSLLLVYAATGVGFFIRGILAPRK